MSEDDTYYQLPSGRFRKIARTGVDGSAGLAREVKLESIKERLPGKELRTLWGGDDQEKIQQNPGEQPGIQPEEVLQQGVLHPGADEGKPNEGSIVEEVHSIQGEEVSGMRNRRTSGRASHRQQSEEQLFTEHNDSLCLMPREMALEERKDDEPQGSLNPDWVCWLMGIPIGWTDIEAEPVEHPGWDEDPAEVWPTPDAFSGMRDGKIDFTTIGRKERGEKRPGGGPVGMCLLWDKRVLTGSDRNIPRLTTRKEHRVNRLKACGNGVVPQQAALALRLLLGIT